MIHWTNYKGHDGCILGKRKKFDNNIYTFDIETSSYFILDGKQFPGCEYENLTKDDQERCNFRSNCYLWMFSINDVVYYGRRLEELKIFWKKINENVIFKKYVFVHNLAFEFQYLKSYFEFSNVIARKSHKVMRCDIEEFDMEFRCSYLMSNCKLEKLTDTFMLPVEKLVGNLDYNLIRTSETELEEKELLYGENDCLVVYHYIKKELEVYETIKNLPLTSTGHVRKELKELTEKDFNYKRLVYKAINTNPHVYNLLQECFMGGYTHANWIYTDSIIENVDSFDFTSSYPYCMTTFRFPSTEFKKCTIKKVEDFISDFAYIVVVKFKNIKSKYYNNFISQSKCRYISGAKYDNGRVMEAKELEIVLTDVDFKFILDTHICSYEILECYYSKYNFLPQQFIDFVLEKYVYKTKYKDVENYGVEYLRQKAMFNSLYGMSVTNTIRDEVIYDNESGWKERELSNDEIIDLLDKEKKKSFLSFAYGVWVTAYARNNLLRNVIELDDFVIYCDTDSIKLAPGYDKRVIEKYNESVVKRIKRVCEILEIDIEKFAPYDSKGNKRMLGLFDNEAKKGHVHAYDRFITQGAKKYAVEIDGEIKITVAGVPKKGSKALKRLEDFKDDFVFTHEYTNKNLLVYTEEQEEFELVDYKGKKSIVNDKSGCCILPTTYVLGKALEYSNLLCENSSNRAKFKEEV